MVKMAIVGAEGSNPIIRTLTGLFKIADISIFSYNSTNYGTFKQLATDTADVFIAPISFYLLERSKMSIDILVFSNNSSLPEDTALNLVNENAVVVINADDKQAHKYLKGTKANLLTYGFNPKASVTASSIEENMEKKFIQICIQRSFKTINDITVEAQEIPVTFSASGDGGILNEIAAITTALVCGVSIKTISLAY